MDSLTLCNDRYLMNLSYNTMLYSDNDTAGNDISFGIGKQGVDVSVTNRLKAPLTLDNLQSLALSIPGLHARHDRLPTLPSSPAPPTHSLANKGLFHCGHLLVYSLRGAPSDKLGGDTATPPGCHLEGGELKASRLDLPTETLLPATLEGDQLSPSPSDLREKCSPGSREGNMQSQVSDSESEYSTCPSQDSFPSAASERWFSAASGSPSPWSPNPQGGTSPAGRGHLDEVVSVEFKGQRFVRVLTPVKGADKGVEAGWTVTDFTECGQLVFSLQLDFMQPRPNVPRWMVGVEEEYW